MPAMNKLIHETSPYLLQHAHNPVDWHPWGDEALGKARSEQKPILLSIGYSACHWCHVMERECFEDKDIAALMNEHFVSIKVDREERPDIDALYMDAVQAMGVRGGWPLNVFLLPDTRPFYGVTYLPAPNWAKLLQSIRHAFNRHYDQLENSARGFAASLSVSEITKFGLEASEDQFRTEEADHMFELLSKNFDTEDGGMDRAPKFVMPAIYRFLLRYYDLTLNPAALRHIELTLNRVALGGIYDHVGGGWARYSVDGEWFIPHFEKMLYDNAQLLSVYAEAFALTQQPLYRDRIVRTISWLETEMRNGEGGFYSAVDADSEGMEGRFYVWTTEELEAALGTDFPAFSTLYALPPEGNWEHGFNHLHFTDLPEHLAAAAGLEETHFAAWYEQALHKLQIHRNRRTRPGLDDKILASWNGLLLKGLCDAYRALGDEGIRRLALACGLFLKEKMTAGGRLYHTYKNGESKLPAFLEDIASVAEGYTALYQVTFDESWLAEARILCDYAITHFYDPDERFFYFTDDSGPALIARKKELLDNVIPSSNSVMAHALFTLGSILDAPRYLDIADQMLRRLRKILMTDPQWAANWAALYCQQAGPVPEIAIVGPDAEALRKDLDRFFIPGKIVTGTTSASGLPLLRDKSTLNGRTAIYVCHHKTCRLPVTSVKEALDQL